MSQSDVDIDIEVEPVVDDEVIVVKILRDRYETEDGRGLMFSVREAQLFARKLTEAAETVVWGGPRDD